MLENNFNSQNERRYREILKEFVKDIKEYQKTMVQKLRKRII